MRLKSEGSLPRLPVEFVKNGGPVDVEKKWIVVSPELQNEVNVDRGKHKLSMTGKDVAQGSTGTTAEIGVSKTFEKVP